MLSGSFADAACLIALLGYMFGNKYLVIKKVSNDVISQIEKDKELTQNQIRVLAEEVNKAKVAAEGIKAAINFTGKK